MRFTSVTNKHILSVFVKTLYFYSVLLLFIVLLEFLLSPHNLPLLLPLNPSPLPPPRFLPPLPPRSLPSCKIENAELQNGKRRIAEWKTQI